MNTKEPFGTFNGVAIEEVRLQSDAGARASILTYGAVLRDLVIGGQRVVLGYESFEPYVSHSPYFGATCGRVANRIANGRFAIDGEVFQVDRNQNGAHTLHGGKENWSRLPWTIVARDRRSVTLAIVSEDGAMGFPGRVDASCVYTLTEPGTLRVELTARTSKPTPINMAHHSYFNLDGSPDVLDHRLTIEADLRTPVDADLIPTGEIVKVAATPWDFRKERPIRHVEDGELVHYDCNFVLRSRGPLARAAIARSLKSNVRLECWTTEPGVQLYDGAKISTPVAGHGGVRYGSRAGFCLEAQRFPDAVNHSHFHGGITRPGELSSQITEYRFTRE